MSALTADEVLARALADLPEGAYVTAAIVVVEYQLPGEEDERERGPWLSWRADTGVGRWTHLGMVESVAGDIRKSLSSSDD
jgi:hypothetical protein